MPDELAALEPSCATEPGVQRLQEEVRQLRRALRSRDVIGQAKGMVRLIAECDEDTAWSVLVRLSQTTNRKVSDLAAEITDDLPGRRLDVDLQAALQAAMDGHVEPRPVPGGAVDLPGAAWFTR